MPCSARLLAKLCQQPASLKDSGAHSPHKDDPPHDRHATAPDSRRAAARRLPACFSLLFLLSTVFMTPAAAADISDSHVSDSLRWGGQADVLTLDPHAQNHPQTQAVLQQVYEGLVRFSPEHQLEPALATHWALRNPLTWRFHIRRDVRFHDGTPLTADDVVFSLERLKMANAPLSALLNEVRSIKRIDDFTVDIILGKPQPLLLNHLVDARILSRDWAHQHGASKAQNLKIYEDTYASRRTNGTGPFRIESWLPSQQLVMTRYQGWWDVQGFPGNITSVHYLPIPGDQARAQALRSGQIDLTTDLPLQQVIALRELPGLHIATAPSQRTLMLGMDQFSATLRHGQAGKANPFKDIRVRQALWLAIDNRQLYRITGQLSRPAGSIAAPGINGWTPSLGRRGPRNLPLARKLMAQAGYADGFEVTLDCSNNRYPFDREICHALVPMWQKIGVRLKVNSMPFASLVPRLETLDSSLWLIGWGSPDFDALQTLLPLAYTRSGKLDGAYNAGRISDPALDQLIDRARLENDPPIRTQLLTEALQLVKTQYYYLPLRHPDRAWVMNDQLALLAPPLERPEMRFIRRQPVAARPAAADKP